MAYGSASRETWPRGWTQDRGCHLLAPGIHGLHPWRPTQARKSVRNWHVTPCSIDQKRVSQTREEDPTLSVPSPNYMQLSKAGSRLEFPSCWFLGPFYYHLWESGQIVGGALIYEHWGPLAGQEAWEASSCQSMCLLSFRKRPILW